MLQPSRARRILLSVKRATDLACERSDRVPFDDRKSSRDGVWDAIRSTRRLAALYGIDPVRGAAGCACARGVMRLPLISPIVGWMRVQHDPRVGLPDPDRDRDRLEGCPRSICQEIKTERDWYRGVHHKHREWAALMLKECALRASVLRDTVVISAVILHSTAELKDVIGLGNSSISYARKRLDKARGIPEYRRPKGVKRPGRRTKQGKLAVEEKAKIPELLRSDVNSSLQYHTRALTGQTSIVYHLRQPLEVIRKACNIACSKTTFHNCVPADVRAGKVEHLVCAACKQFDAALQALLAMATRLYRRAEGRVLRRGAGRGAGAMASGLLLIETSLGQELGQLQADVEVVRAALQKGKQHFNTLPALLRADRNAHVEPMLHAHLGKPSVLDREQARARPRDNCRAACQDVCGEARRSGRGPTRRGDRQSRARRSPLAGTRAEERARQRTAGMTFRCGSRRRAGP